MPATTMTAWPRPLKPQGLVLCSIRIHLDRVCDTALTFARDIYGFRPPDGESFNDLVLRVSPFSVNCPCLRMPCWSPMPA